MNFSTGNLFSLISLDNMNSALKSIFECSKATSTSKDLGFNNNLYHRKRKVESIYLTLNCSKEIRFCNRYSFDRTTSFWFGSTS